MKSKIVGKNKFTKEERKAIEEIAKEKVLKEFRVNINTWNHELINNVIDRILFLRNEEFEKFIEDIDLELFFEDVVDTNTGEKVEIPKEVLDLWDIYWEHIQGKLKQKLKERV